jgi:hypothetical protein
VRRKRKKGTMKEMDDEEKGTETTRRRMETE